MPSNATANAAGHSPLDDPRLIDHGLTEIPVHFSMPVGTSVSIGPDHLKRLFAVGDADLMNTQSVRLSNLHVTGPDAAGVLVSGQGGAKAAIAERMGSVQHDSGALESVHAIASPHFVQEPVTLNFANSGLKKDVIRTAVARIARWQDVDVDNMDHDIEHVTHGDVTRHLVPTLVTTSSSPITTLFGRNANNPAFFDGAYADGTRNEVPSGHFVVTNAHMLHANESLLANLKVKTNMKSGFMIHANPLHNSKHKGVVSGVATFRRVPLNASHIDGSPPDADDAGSAPVTTLSHALNLMGEDHAEDTLVGEADNHSAAFKFDMND